MKHATKKIYQLMLTFVVFVVASCETEYLNPSAASQSQAVSDANALIALANGLQQKYSVGGASPEYALASANGLLTKELLVLNAGNTNELLLSQGGGSVQGNNSILSNLWNQSNLVRANANIILENLGVVGDQGTKGALQAHASIYKALALGNLAIFWEKAPSKVETNTTFVDRVIILNEAITTLEAASVELAKAPIPATFTAGIVSGLSYANTINALIARYALMVGNYDKAITAANAVSLAVTVKSVMNHDDISPNALFFSSFSARNNTEPTDGSFSLPVALQTNPLDKRIGFFFLSGNPAVTKVNRGRAGFFQANNSAIPIYRPGEIILIKAEANVRKSTQDLAAAVTELNNILTKIPSSDAFGIGADLPAYSGANTAPAILDEIYKQRCIELYLTGLRLEDSRRFGRPGPGATGAERSRNFLPYPFSERDNNPNTPADPAN
jgi:starch-binding outer membrane protein, SusD/RagB family